MRATEIKVARQALCLREGIVQQNEKTHIGSWSSGQPSPNLICDLPEWAESRGVHHVIWTALPPKFNKSMQTPTQEQVVQYLSALTGSKRDNAERYIRSTPKQIDTAYRRNIEERLQWLPHSGML
jgi:hypothetical protein